MAIWDAVRNLINQWPAGEQSAQTTALRNCMCTIRGGAGYWDGGTNSESTPPRIRCRLVDLAAGNVAVVVSSPVLGLATIAAGTNVDNVVVVTLASDGRGGAHPRRYRTGFCADGVRCDGMGLVQVSCVDDTDVTAHTYVRNHQW